MFVLKVNAVYTCHWTGVTELWNAVSVVLLFVNVQVPTMIVYGEKDRMMVHDEKDTQITHAPVRTLKQFPNSEVFVMKKAGHACYMDNRDEWHRLLYNFIKSSQVFEG